MTDSKASSAARPSDTDPSAESTPPAESAERSTPPAELRLVKQAMQEVPRRFDDADSNEEDRVWVAATVEGQTEMFDRIYVKYRDLVYRIAYRILRNKDDALEVAQETFVKAYNALHRLDNTRPFQPWLRRIAINASIDRWRRKRTRKEVRGEPEEGNAYYDQKQKSESPGGEIVREEVREAIMAAVEGLPEKQRVTFCLYSYEGLNYPQIAEYLDIPIGTVMSRLYHARRSIQAALPADWDPGGPRKREDRRRD